MAMFTKEQLELAEAKVKEHIKNCKLKETEDINSLAHKLNISEVEAATLWDEAWDKA